MTAVVAVVLALLQEPHRSHQVSAIPLETLQRPVTLRTAIGRAHDDITTTSKEAQAFYDQGLAYLHAFVWIEAARTFHAALRLDPNLALAYVGLSVAYVELSRPVDARAAIETARRLAVQLPNHDQRHVEARWRQMAAEEAPGDAAKLGAYRAALDEGLAAFPQDVELLLWRGIAESADASDRGQGSTPASLAYYMRALAVSPDHPAAHHYLAHAAENSGRIEDARRHSTAFATAASQVPHARHMHGHALRRSGRTQEAIVEFEAADRLHREYAAREKIVLHHDWHVEHNLALLAASLQHVGEMKRAATLYKAAFDLPTTLLVQAYNKREWPMFLRGRGRLAEAAQAASVLTAHAHPVVQATGHIETGLTLLVQNRWGEAAHASNAALRLLRTAPGGTIAASALLALQGEFNLRTAERRKGRATLEDVARRVRAMPGPDAWGQALFTLEAIARSARAVGDWELAGGMAAQMLEHDPSYGGSHYARALVAENNGDHATAKAAFARALECWVSADADLPEVQEIRRKLR